VNAPEHRTELDPVAIQQINLVTIAALNEWVQNHFEVVQSRPESPGSSCQRSNDVRDALLAEELGQRHGCFVEVAAAQFQEVRRCIVVHDAIDGGVWIGAEGKKGDLSDTQSILSLQAGEDLVVLDLRFFKHGYVKR
jgi:hypothetical protein